ncbi:iron-sulfur cluster carrier protein ApbC [Thorsellia kenyensis]|uniref:Iron-sulfur cluster carrier protein n=1 Tax=Thorsellia kenyensis TaxID=1549888 RepID=A0ABV6C905_9GAMM
MPASSKRFNSLNDHQLEVLTSVFKEYSSFTLETSLTTDFLISENCLLNCSIDESLELFLNFHFPFAWQAGFLKMKEQLEPLLLHKLSIPSIKWIYNSQVLIHKPLTHVKGVKHIIAISSGKGGVGKSSTAVNLAAALSVQGAKVGILDADIYGPSIPTMLSMADADLTSLDGKLMEPVKSFGLVTNSIGYLSKGNDAMIWRGPMASKALIQLLQETNWPDLDYLILDMPPGTGDIQITLGQQIELSGAIIITTPQDIALLDVKKGVMMFNEVKVPLLGIIENMSWHTCESCGHESHPFGIDGAKKIAEEFKLPLLANIPLDIVLREDLDAGCPTTIARPNHRITEIFTNLAARVAAMTYSNCAKKQKKEIPLQFIDASK